MFHISQPSSCLMNYDVNKDYACSWFAVLALTSHSCKHTPAQQSLQRKDIKPIPLGSLQMRLETWLLKCSAEAGVESQ